MVTFQEVWGRERGYFDTGDVEVADNDAGCLTAYRRHPDVRRCVDLRARQTFDFNTLVYFRGSPDPSDTYSAISPLSTVRSDVEASLRAMSWNASFFRNGARLSGILELPGDLMDEQREAAEESFRRAYTSGSDTANKVAVLYDGAKYTEIGTRPKDADWQALCQATKGQFQFP